MRRGPGRLGGLLGAALTAAVVAAPVASASAEQLCGDLGAAWDGARCSTVVTSQRNATRLIWFDLPAAQLDDPTAGPPLSNYYHRLMDGWRQSAADSPRESSAFATYRVYHGPGGVQSVIVHETFEPFGMQANNAFRSFVFDMGQGRRLMLADLFKPGVDPMVALPPATVPFLPAALDAAAPPHAPGTYPFTVEEFTPSPRGPGYTGEYRSFALDGDQLLLFLPDAPMLREDPSPQDRLVWSMDGGTVQVRVPLAALADSLRPEYGGS